MNVPHRFHRLLIGFLLPVLFMGTVLAFDLAEPFRSVTPPLFSIGLLLFSFLISPRWMIFWAVVYSAIVACILLNPALYSVFSGGWSPPEILSHKFRVLGFCSTAFFSCLFCSTLDRLRRKRDMLDNLILRMPLPVVVSGIDGEIHLLNERARQLLGRNSSDLQKSLFFDLLAPKKAQGKCIAAYLNFFKLGIDTEDSLDLELAGRPIRAEVAIIESNSPKLVTMLLPDDSEHTHDKPRT